VADSSDDARTALLTRLFDHAPTFPPASLPTAEALDEDRRARASEHAWLLGRLVWPASHLSELPQDEHRALAVVDGSTEQQDEKTFVEGVSKIRCGGASIPSVADVAAFIRGCREQGVLFKATAGLHHAYPTDAGEHGFLNVLAAAVFGDEEDALRERPGAFELDASSFRWRGRAAEAQQLADVRASLFHSIGSCSFFEPVGELEGLGIL
jgi:hypothetical protein